MGYKKIIASFFTLLVLFFPLAAFAEAPTQGTVSSHSYTDADVLLRGRLYYSYLDQFFNNIVNDYPDATEVTLTGAISLSINDYTSQADLDADARPENIDRPAICIEYTVVDSNQATNTYYAHALLPISSLTKGGLAQNIYTTSIKSFTSPSFRSEILGNGFVKYSAYYKVRLNLQDYISSGYPITKSQVNSIRAAKAASIVESPDRYYGNLEKLLITRGSNTETNEVIVCVKGVYTDDELAQISYTDDSKIQYWMDYYTLNLNNDRIRVKKAYSVLSDITVIGNAPAYNEMSLIANGRNSSYAEIAPGMYRNANGWTVFRVDLNDYASKGYVY